MKFEEALKHLTLNGSRITRDRFPFYLSINSDGYLALYDSHHEITPYVISTWDFDYDWEVKK